MTRSRTAGAGEVLKLKRGAQAERGVRFDLAPGTAGVLASEFGWRLAARTGCWGEDAPQLAAEDGCGTRDCGA